MGVGNEMKAHCFHHHCVIIPPLSLWFSSTVVWFVSPHSLNSDSLSPVPTGIFLYPKAYIKHALRQADAAPVSQTSNKARAYSQYETVTKHPVPSRNAGITLRWVNVCCALEEETDRNESHVLLAAQYPVFIVKMFLIVWTLAAQSRSSEAMRVILIP